MRRADRRRRDRQARAMQQVSYTPDLRRAYPAEPVREVGRQQHSDADCLSVQPLAVTGSLLDRVAEGVAEVQQRTTTVLALVLGDDRGLDLAGAADRKGERRGLQCEQRRHVGIEPVEKARVRDQPVLDHFGEPGTQLARRQRAERRRVRQHGPRLVKRADQVLAARVIHARLAAHRRIHLREQGRRHLHEIHAALVAGGRKTGHVPHHSAAERDHAGVAVHPSLHQRVEDAPGHLERLVLLAVRQPHARHPAAFERAEQSIEVQRADDLVGHDQHVARGDGARELARVVDQPRADQDRVASFAEVDRQSLHHSLRPESRRRTISSTTEPTLRPSVSTMTSATSS